LFMRSSREAWTSRLFAYTKTPPPPPGPRKGSKGGIVT
jgi:hypothetical protein